jgi:hypothetical protein
MNRHHKRHQAMWLGIWSGRRKGEDRWERFVARYKAFLPEDWVRVCIRHHAEIHVIYDGIIEADKTKVGRPLSDYTWTQAEALMDKLEAACLRWLKMQSPGVDAADFERRRLLRQKRAEQVKKNKH